MIRWLLVVVFLWDGAEANPLPWMPEVNATYACELLNQNGVCQFEDTAFMQQSCPDSEFMLLFQAIMMARCDVSDPCRRHETNDIDEVEIFDFIIVGAGVAGPVIARRLTDHEPWWRVLLIEAGPPEPTMTSFPAFAVSAKGTKLDWQYKTEPTVPHPTACLESNGVCRWSRGKMVSGSSGMNGMMYNRGHPEIYNDWARDGNTGWSYEEVKRYFDRAEDTQVPGMTTDPENWITTEPGPLKINYFPYRPVFADYLLRATGELGFETTALREWNQTGFMVAPVLVADGQRATAARMYLRPIAHKTNLKVLINAHVTRIVRKDGSDEAAGVELINKNGDKKVIFAEKEVILTAGTIGSAQILLNSGIGPKEDLEKLKIPVWKDLPVGQNLHNHVSVPIKMSINSTNYQVITASAVREFLDSRTGPLASSGLTQVTGFVESSYAKPGVPDLQLFFHGFSPRTCPKLGVDGECGDGTVGNCPPRRVIMIMPTTVSIKSRGELKLRSNNPLDKPLLYPNYLTDEEDINILIEGIRLVEDLTKTPTMKEWDLRFEDPKVPACSRFHFGTDRFWRCLIRTRTGPENHQAGTNKMGPVGDPTAVVDPRLRVQGVDNVRVADASIQPNLVNTNPSASIVMIAEKAADMIERTWTDVRVSRATISPLRDLLRMELLRHGIHISAAELDELLIEIEMSRASSQGNTHTSGSAGAGGGAQGGLQGSAGSQGNAGADGTVGVGNAGQGLQASVGTSQGRAGGGSGAGGGAQVGLQGSASSQGGAGGGGRIGAGKEGRGGLQASVSTSQGSAGGAQGAGGGSVKADVPSKGNGQVANQIQIVSEGGRDAQISGGGKIQGGGQAWGQGHQVQTSRGFGVAGESQQETVGGKNPEKAKIINNAIVDAKGIADIIGNTGDLLQLLFSRTKHLKKSKKYKG